MLKKGNKRLEEAFNNKEVLTATVANVLDGGLSVIVEETRVFIPASLVSDSYEKILENMTDRKLASLSQNLIQENAVSSVTENSFS